MVENKILEKTFAGEAGMTNGAVLVDDNAHAPLIDMNEPSIKPRVSTSSVARLHFTKKSSKYVIFTQKERGY